MSGGQSLKENTDGSCPAGESDGQRLRHLARLVAPYGLLVVTSVVLVVVLGLTAIVSTVAVGEYIAATLVVVMLIGGQALEQ